MIANPIFIDTNMLIYAHDNTAGKKHDQAKTMIRELWLSDTLPFLSIQVLQEFYVNLVKKGVQGKDVEACVQDYLTWNIIENTVSVFIQGMDYKRRFHISLWDALILSAAKQSGAKTLWSEDFNHGQDYNGVKVLNPFFKRQ